MQRSWWTLAVLVAGCGAPGDDGLDSDDPFPFDAEGGDAGSGVDLPSFDSAEDGAGGDIDAAECPASADESLSASAVVDGAVTLTHTGLDLALCEWTPVATVDTTNLQIAITHTTDDISACGEVCDFGFTYEISDLAPGLWTIYAGSQVIELDVD